MSTARKFLAAAQQRADAATPQAVRDEPWIAQALAADSTVLVAALTAVLDLAETNQYDANQDRMGFTPVLSKGTVRAVIAAALTPKENDS